MDYYKEEEKISRKLLAFNLALVLAIVLMVFKIYDVQHKPKEVMASVVEAVVETSPFDSIELGAKAAYVYDVLEQKAVYEKNEFVQLPLASITKLMMALTAVELSPEDLKIKINRNFLEEQGDSGLLAGEVWSLKDLIDYSLVVSSNDGAR